MKTLLKLASVGFLSTQLLTPLAAQVEYTVTNIGTFGGDSTAWTINERGHVAGWSVIIGPQGLTEGYFWSPETGMVGVGQLPGLLDTFALGLADDGTLTGNGGRAFEDSRSFTWTLDDGLSPIPLNGEEIAALDINDSGQVTGRLDLSFFASNPFLFEDGVTTDLGGPVGSDFNSGESINNLGHIAVGADSNVFILRDGEFVLQQSLGGSFSSVDEINDLSEAAGNSRTPGNDLRAVLWQDGQPLDLGVFNENDPDAFSFAWGLNNRGTVIGEVFPGPDGGVSEFICEDGCPEGLSFLQDQVPDSVVISDVFDINDAGQIVGRGTINGGFVTSILLTPLDPHPVVINPIPGVAGATSDFDLLHFEPFSEVTLFASLSSGTAELSECPGLQLDLALNPRDLGTTIVDGEGAGSFEVFIPAGADGRTAFFQAVDLENCDASAVTAHRF